jgi:nucleoside-diphosphate-sugar epimerase
MELSIVNGVKWVITASRGSVYGVSKEPRVCEENDLNAICAYNKVKIAKERIVQSYAGNISTLILRAATVAGVSARQRIYLAVNILTYQALNNGVIKVLGGSQMRPQVHLHDMLRSNLFFVNNDLEETHNVRFENITMLALPNKISRFAGVRIEVEESNPRFYRHCSHKWTDTGFTTEETTEDAISEIILFLQ